MGDTIDRPRLWGTMNGPNGAGEHQMKQSKSTPLAAVLRTNCRMTEGEHQMKQSKSTPLTTHDGNGQERNRLEIIRFASREDCSRAIGVLIERGMRNVASTVVNQWAVRTDVVRVLRACGIPFEWVTENV